MSQSDYSTFLAGWTILLGALTRLAMIQGQRPTGREEYRDRFGIEFGHMTREQIAEAMRERRMRDR